ncbi:hypothetical protein M3Y97_01031000 [Aphelenchoides bicaudatus]|nr:hypothetical protein M3Y97_01031000 [Aphelenchoides bicaudatus]
MSAAAELLAPVPPPDVLAPQQFPALTPQQNHLHLHTMEEVEAVNEQDDKSNLTVFQTPEVTGEATPDENVAESDQNPPEVNIESNEIEETVEPVEVDEAKDDEQHSLDTKMEEMAIDQVAPEDPDQSSHFEHSVPETNQQGIPLIKPLQIEKPKKSKKVANSEDADESVDKKKSKSETKFLNMDQKRRFNEWMSAHSGNLYPTKEEKFQLMESLNATYLQVTRLLANHRRRLQLQRKRKPPTNDIQKDQTDKENRLDGALDHANMDKHGIDMFGRHGDDETRMSLHCDESFEDLDEPADPHPSIQMKSPKSSKALSERNQRIDFVIDEVVQTVLYGKPSGDEKDMVVHGTTTSVDELQRRVATLMQIQQEMQARTMVKEYDSNYVTPPPSAPLDHLQQMPTMQPPAHSTQQISPQIEMRRAPSPVVAPINHLQPQQQPICDFSAQQLIDQTYQQSETTPQIPINNFQQLNINQLLNQQHQQQQTTTQPATNQATSLLPLIQKFLTGEFGRSDAEKQEQAAAQLKQAQTQAQQPTGTSLALNQLIGNNSQANAVVAPQSQLSPLLQAQNQPNQPDQMLYPGLHANLLNAFASMNGANPNQAAAYMGAPPNQFQQSLDILQQALMRQQQQNSILSLLQNREQLTKLTSPTQLPTDFLVTPQPTFNEKVANFASPATNPTLLSPPLSSNSPFSSEKSPPPEKSVTPPEKSVTPTAHVFATPPATIKPKKMTKKQLKAMEDGATPTSGRKRQATTKKRETKAEKRARLAATIVKPTFAPRELTANEHIALEVLTGLANGRFN